MNIQTLLSEFNNGSPFALSKLINLVENRSPGWKEVMKSIYPQTGNGRVIGITGPPGAGKSTLTNVVSKQLVQLGHSVGVIAIDPTSHFTGGALLGDRVRMTPNHSSDVFIRSMATRGAIGGLSRAVRNVVNLMDAFGKEFILIETVGVGQDEIDIINVADFVAVVCVPGLGDSIQANKAGLMEIASVFVVNKFDKDGADQTVSDLQNMIAMKINHDSDKPNPEIYKTVATKGDGIIPLVEHIVDLATTKSRLYETKVSHIRSEVISIIIDNISNIIKDQLKHDSVFDKAVDSIWQKKDNPYSLAEKMTNDLFPDHEI